MNRTRINTSASSTLSLATRFACQLLTVGSLLVFATGWAGQRGVPAQGGITNFGKVDDRLYRGAQLDENGIKSLQQLGVKTIINLRQPNDLWPAEAAIAKAGGIGYTNVPLNSLTRPTDEQIKTILALIENSPAPVFVHCQHGCDRTGTVIACYRIEHDGWSSAAALAEADHYGLSNWELGMRSFIADFGKSKAGKGHASP